MTLTFLDSNIFSYVEAEHSLCRSRSLWDLYLCYSSSLWDVSSSHEPRCSIQLAPLNPSMSLWHPIGFSPLQDPVWSSSAIVLSARSLLVALSSDWHSFKALLDFFFFFWVSHLGTISFLPISLMHYWLTSSVVTSFDLWCFLHHCFHIRRLFFLNVSFSSAHDPLSFF